jgi:hypothetical protein
MKRIPIRSSLAVQCAEILREAIHDGAWSRWLPGEHELAMRLKVSRITIRTALARLESEGILRGGRGRRREILGQARRVTPLVNHTVIFLSPLPPWKLPSATMLWLDAVRGNLAADGWALETHASANAFGRRPASVLEELVTRWRPAAWVLHRSTLEMQRWYSERALPAVIAGTRHSDIRLPAVDIDHYESGFHAAGRFSARGLERLFVVREKTRLAGDLNCLAGFRLGAGRTECADIVHDGTPHGIANALDCHLKNKKPPCGIFALQAIECLTVLAWLRERGFRIPEDAAVISRNDEPFLAYAVPEPARYWIKVELFAQGITRVLSQLLHNGPGIIHQQLIMPAFKKGKTL